MPKNTQTHSTPAPEKTELLLACRELSGAAYQCERASENLESVNSLARPDALVALQQSVERANRALRRVFAEAHALTEVQDLASLVAPTTTPAGVDLDSQLSRDELTARAYNCLVAGGVKTVRAFCGLELSDLMKFRGLGRGTLAEVELYRTKLGLPL